MTKVKEEEVLKPLEEYPKGYFFATATGLNAFTLLGDGKRYNPKYGVLTDRLATTRAGTHPEIVRVGFIPSAFFS